MFPCVFFPREYNRARPGPDSREVAMPVYEYVCLDCKKKFSEVKPVSAYDPRAAKCPRCDGKHVERRYSQIYVETSTKS
jgi:putative FmdB family regulatory protein